ncbi:hypothetical protein DIPPA_09560 [Diplonema papillatum]|nr:hypothetical protein DIPPA_09560 [Diplonema papillatum]
MANKPKPHPAAEEARIKAEEQQQKRMQHMQERAKEQELREQLQKQEYARVKRAKPLHVVMAERAAAAAEEAENERLQRLRAIKKERGPKDLGAELAKHEQLYMKNREEKLSPGRGMDPKADWKTPIPQHHYYVGKSHHLVTEQIEQARREQELRQKDVDQRRKRVQNFSELVRAMYPPKAPAAPHHNQQQQQHRPATHGQPAAGDPQAGSPLPALRATQPPPHPPAAHPSPPSPSEARKRGAEYLKAAKLLGKPNTSKPKLDPILENPWSAKPERTEAQKKGDDYLEEAKKLAKQVTTRKMSEEEKREQLQALRKRAHRLAYHVAPETAEAENVAENQANNQQYFAAIAAKMDLLLALQQ